MYDCGIRIDIQMIVLKVNRRSQVQSLILSGAFFSTTWPIHYKETLLPLDYEKEKKTLFYEPN